MSEFPYVSGYKQSRRDSAVAAVVNWIIDTFATSAYRAFVIDTIHLGREEFQRRLAEERKVDPDEFLGGDGDED